jgi:hypothetical protein
MKFISTGLLSSHWQCQFGVMNMFRKTISVQSWRHRILAAPLLLAAAVVVDAGAVSFVPGIAQATPAERQQGFEAGQRDGYNRGREDGYNHAYKASYRVGLEDSFRYYDRRPGRSDDFKRGYDYGYDMGYERGFYVGSRAGDRDGYENGRIDGSVYRDRLREQAHERECRRYGVC